MINYYLILNWSSHVTAFFTFCLLCFVTLMFACSLYGSRPCIARAFTGYYRTEKKHVFAILCHLYSDRDKTIENCCNLEWLIHWTELLCLKQPSLLRVLLHYTLVYIISSVDYGAVRTRLFWPYCVVTLCWYPHYGHTGTRHYLCHVDKG